MTAVKFKHWECPPTEPGDYLNDLDVSPDLFETPQILSEGIKRVRELEMVAFEFYSPLTQPSIAASDGIARHDARMSPMDMDIHLDEPIAGEKRWGESVPNVQWTFADWRTPMPGKA